MAGRRVAAKDIPVALAVRRAHVGDDEELAKGTGENAVARAIRDALKAQLDSKRFHVEIDDGEDILIKKRGRTPDIALQVAENTVAGVRLNSDKE